MGLRRWRCEYDCGEGRRFKTPRQQGLLSAEYPLKSTLPFVICIQNIGTIEQNLPHQEICQKLKKIRYHCWRIGVGMGRVEVDTSFSQHLS